ncbi:hypothetical protein OO012_18695 [Rhodobacteraceae bacterium KMM 6894]|nr:hypothetical protein [Rhodobacteraceae bacterium KMM 6894]
MGTVSQVCVKPELIVNVASIARKNKIGPDLPFASSPSAAVQLHQTGHSSIV